MTTTPTPAEIEAFQKGLKLGLVPEGWVQRFHPLDSSKDYFTRGKLMTDNPTALDIQAMEGLASRELHLSEHGIRYHHDTGRWIFTNRGACVSWIERTESEHLPALVDAVRRMRG